MLDPIVIKVANGILPKYQNDEKSLLRYFTLLNNGFGVMNGMVYGSIAILAPILVAILYGKDYLYIVDIVKILSILIYFRSISGLVGTLAITKGRTDLEFYWNLFTLLVFPLAIVLGSKYGVLGVFIESFLAGL